MKEVTYPAFEAFWNNLSINVSITTGNFQDHRGEFVVHRKKQRFPVLPQMVYRSSVCPISKGLLSLGFLVSKNEPFGSATCSSMVLCFNSMQMDGWTDGG